MDMDFEQYHMLMEYLEALKIVKIGVDHGIRPAELKNLSITPTYYGGYSLIGVFDKVLSTRFETAIHDAYDKEYEILVTNFLKECEFSESGRKNVQEAYEQSELILYEIKSPLFKDFPIEIIDWDGSMTFARTESSLYLCCAVQFGDPDLTIPLLEIMSFYKKKQLSGVKS